MNADKIKDIVKVATPLVIAVLAYLLQVDPLDLCAPVVQ